MTHNRTNCIGAQGELRVYKIDSLPEGIDFKKPDVDAMGNHILSHSEKGHNHVIDGNTAVLEHTAQVGDMAMRTFYAIVKNPTSLHQTATHNHSDIALDEGIYAICVDVEYDPFADMIAEVRD